MKKIMFVDDEPDQIGTIRKALKDAGTDYELIPAESGKQCLELLKNNEIPDLILLDIMMPEMDGFEVIQQVKTNPRWRDILIIVVTAKDLTDSDWGILHRSVDRIIQKSGLARDGLMKEVQSLLREHDASRKEDCIHEEGPGGGGC